MLKISLFHRTLKKSNYRSCYSKLESRIGMPEFKVCMQNDIH